MARVVEVVAVDLVVEVAVEDSISPIILKVDPVADEVHLIRAHLSVSFHWETLFTPVRMILFVK